MTTALEVVFWASAGLLLYTQLGYALLLAALERILSPAGARGEPSMVAGANPGTPSVSLIIAAHDESPVIAGKVADALALEYPRQRLEVVVSCDGCSDDTPRRAAEAGADVVLELPRGGKVRAQNAAVARSGAQIVAFSDANARWRPDALARLVHALGEPGVGYACGQVRFEGAAGATNQEGLYWRYEMSVRARESRLASITAGNGAIYATRREAYVVVDPIMGHDLSLPFNLVKRGWRAVYVPEASATEKMVPSVDGEFRRKRRMMSHTWPIVLRGGLLSPRGYGPRYTLMIFSHRLLRYLSPALHLLALASSAALAGRSATIAVALGLQLALLAAAALAGALPLRPLLIARYYVLSIASLGAGLWDWLRHGTPAAWEAAEGTR